MDKHDELVLKIARETHIIGHTFAPVSDDVINFARRLRAKWEKEQGLTRHEFYKDGDKNVPEQIKDRNGQVVLTLCKLCNQAEGELESDYCPQPTESRAEWKKEHVERDDAIDAAIAAREGE